MSEEKVHRVGVILNGVTGRMGANQHLMRSIVEIIRQGGVEVSPTERIMPDPVLVGRNARKLADLAERSGVTNYTTNLEEALDDDNYSVYFDAQTTLRRFDAVKAAAQAGKHVYCEKPTAVSVKQAVELYTICRDAGVKHGVVQDKLWLPGLVKLRRLMETGFFGDLLSVRGEFGYWVFPGHSVPGQRPSWNYRKEDGGGVALDMLCHWRYVIDNLFGPVKAISCMLATHVPERVDEAGKSYPCTADDSAYATFELEGGVIAHFNSSWAVRVRRDDLLTVQVDGANGTAVAGLRDCWIQPDGATPRPTWNPDVPQPINFFDGWMKLPEQETHDNAFKAQWELFLRHVALDEPFRWGLMEGAKGVQLAELGIESSRQRRWLDVEDLESERLA